MKNMKYARAGKILLPSILILLCIVLKILPPSLIMYTDDNTIVKILGDVSDEFEIEFKHSVNQGIVIERYKLDYTTKTMYLQTGYFENYGAGMLDTIPEGYTFSEEGDFLRIDFPENPTNSIRIAAAGIAGHQITFGHKTVDLYKEAPMQSVIIEICRLSPLEYILKRRI